jgi:hypothetical protein
MKYVPNTIRICTHGVDLWHHGLEFKESTPNHQWSCPKVEREEKRRKKMRQKEKRYPNLFCGLVTLINMMTEQTQLEIVESKNNSSDSFIKI